MKLVNNRLSDLVSVYLSGSTMVKCFKKQFVLEILCYIYNNQIFIECVCVCVLIEYKDEGNPRGKTSCQYHPLGIGCIDWCCNFTFFGGGGMDISDEAKFFAPQSQKCSDCMEEIVIWE